MIHGSPPCGSECSELLLSTIMEKNATESQIPDIQTFTIKFIPKVKNIIHLQSKEDISDKSRYRKAPAVYHLPKSEHLISESVVCC